MQENSDWYPQTNAEKHDMFTAIFTNIDEVDLTLKMEKVHKDRLKQIAEMYLAYDENLKLNRAALKAQETGFQTIQTGEKGADPMPALPKYHLLTLPEGDFVGMETEIRDLRRYMKGLFTWTDNMGDILKMNGKASTARNEDEMFPNVNIKQIEGLKIYTNAKKEGMDGIEYQWRIAGASVWQPLMNSGEADTILEIPIETGKAEKIELRAIFLRKFKRVGKWSPTYNATVGG